MKCDRCAKQELAVLRGSSEGALRLFNTPDLACGLPCQFTFYVAMFCWGRAALYSLRVERRLLVTHCHRCCGQ